MSRILVKISGKLISPTVFGELAANIAKLHANGDQVVVVHGGGKPISKELAEKNIPVEFIDGMRVTSEEAIHVVEGVLAGQINKQLTRWLNQAQVPAIGISGSDNRLIQADQVDPRLGYVGQISKINPEIIHSLWDMGLAVVVAPTGVSEDAACLNINADISAGALASALEVDLLVLFTDTAGVLRDGKTIPALSQFDIRKFISEGFAKDGMIPKLTACQTAKKAGIPKVKIAPWAGPDTLSQLIENESIGTEIF